MNRNKSVLLRLLIYTTNITMLGYSFWSMTSECETAHPKLSDITFHAASVMPVMWRTIPNQSPAQYVLLSREAGGNDKGTYDDWGGSRDQHDQHPRITAAREFSEEAITHETLGLECHAIKKYIAVDNDRTFFVAVQKGIGRTHKREAGSTMVTYITLFETEKIEQLIDRFYQARENAHSWKYKEKDILALVSWDNLSTTIRNSRYARNITTTADTIDPDTRKLEPKTITLRPALVAKLRSLFKGRPHTYGTSKRILFFEPYQQEVSKKTE